MWFGKVFEDPEFQNEPFEIPKPSDWSRIVFFGYSWFRDPKYKGDDNPPYFEVMKQHRLEIDTPTILAWYRNKHLPLGNELPPPRDEEATGGVVTAKAPLQPLDVEEDPCEEPQARHNVIAHLAWAVDIGATFDTVPLGYAK